MDLFNKGKFTLSSGQESNFKIDCDALSDNELDLIAELAISLYPPITRTVPVPTGGNRLAQAIFKQVAAGGADGVIGDVGIVLVVDDVCTTGASIRELYNDVALKSPQGTRVEGFVIFNRGSFSPWWLTSLFELNYEAQKQWREHAFKSTE